MNKKSTGRKLSLENLEQREMLAVFTVDDSFASNNVAQRQYTTIQAAVDAASNGDKINVRPGTYEENVIVNKQLRIKGPDARLSQYLDSTKAAIVDPGDDGVAGDPAIAFDLVANGIEIEGFTIGEFDGAADPDGVVGVRTSNAFSGYEIEDNVIENNTIGIYLNTATTLSGTARPLRTEVEDNVIRNNDIPGAASGNGIYSDQGLQNVSIEDNVFSGRNFNDGITIVNAPDQTTNPTLQSNIRIRDNYFKESTGGGIYLESVTDSSIKDNKFTRTALNGIQLNGGCQNVTIEDNKLDTVGTDGYHGIILSNESGDGPNSNIRVKENRLYNPGLSGIVVRDTTSSLIKENTIKGAQGFTPDPLSQWGNGISLEGASTNNRIEENKVSGSQRNGIFVADTAINNTFVENTSKDNNTGGFVDAYDYNDQTPVPPAPVTLNTYKKNRGRTQNRPGLIQKFI